MISQPSATGQPHARPRDGGLPPRQHGGSRDAAGTPEGTASAPAPGSQPILATGPARRRTRENDEYAAFARRVLRAWARRVAAGDIDAITAMNAAARDLDDAIREAVTGLRGRGYSWAEIAARLGITRQAAWQRWGSHRD